MYHHPARHGYHTQDVRPQLSGLAVTGVVFAYASLLTSFLVFAISIVENNNAIMLSVYVVLGAPALVAVVCGVVALRAIGARQRRGRSAALQALWVGVGSFSMGYLPALISMAG